MEIDDFSSIHVFPRKNHASIMGSWRIISRSFFSIVRTMNVRDVREYFCSSFVILLRKTFGDWWFWAIYYGVRLVYMAKYESIDLRNDYRGRSVFFFLDRTNEKEESREYQFYSSFVTLLWKLSVIDDFEWSIVSIDPFFLIFSYFSFLYRTPDKREIIRRFSFLCMITFGDW